MWPLTFFIVGIATLTVGILRLYAISRQPEPEELPDLHPIMKQRELPFDRNLAALGILEPVFVQVPDLEAWDKQLLSASELDYEYVYEMGDSRPVAIMSQQATPEWHEAPSKTELRWRNTLAEEPEEPVRHAPYGRNHPFRTRAWIRP